MTPQDLAPDIDLIALWVKQYKTEQALDYIQKLVDTGALHPDLYYWQGKIYQQRQDYGLALNAYQKALDLYPHHKGAETGITMVQAILQIANSYYYENPYTDEELYE